MKKIAFVLFAFLACSFCGSAQINTSNPIRDSASAYTNADNSGFYRQPAICDTLNHVFSLILDSFKVTTGHDYRSVKSDSEINRVYTASNSEKPMPRTNSMFTSPPFAFYCPYQSGKDSALMFRVFTELVGNIKECLLNGPAKDVEIYYLHDAENARILRFGYNVKTLKNGVDPKMKTVSVMVEFNPDQSGRQLDYYTLYRVNLIVHH